METHIFRALSTRYRVPWAFVLYLCSKLYMLDSSVRASLYKSCDILLTPWSSRNEYVHQSFTREYGPDRSTVDMVSLACSRLTARLALRIIVQIGRSTVALQAWKAGHASLTDRSESLHRPGDLRSRLLNRCSLLLLPLLRSE